jgi:cation diffusion facilitator family transporter
VNKLTVAVITVIGGFVIFGLKLLAFAVSGSIALLSDALESIVNIVASIMMFFSVKMSGKPPDSNHNYGHEKIENISAFIEGVLVVIAALLIVYTAIGRLRNPTFELLELNIAVGISFLAMFSNLGLSVLLRRTAKNTGSMALEGDSKHLLSDVFSSVAVNAGLLVANFTGLKILDPLLALMVAFLVGKMGIELIQKSGKHLMDTSADDEQEKIEDLLKDHKPKFINYHNVKTRKSGSKVFAELHLTVDSNLTVQEAHDFTKHLEEDIRQKMPEVSITIHVEPPKAHSDVD